MPTVSVIVPVYNVEAYVEECIESVLAQTWEDYELILVDDGSTDGSGMILDRYGEMDVRINVIHKKNGGLSSARNAGLDAATGKYIYFLDGDDRMLRNLLETVIPEMDRGYDLVAFDYTFLPHNPDYHGYIKKRTEYLLDDKKLPDFLCNEVFRGKTHWEAWNRMFVRELIEKNGIRFVDNRKIFAEDLCFQLFYLAFTQRILLIPDVLYEYRLRENSILDTSAGESKLNEMTALACIVRNYYAPLPNHEFLNKRYDLIFYMIIRGSIMKMDRLRIMNKHSLRYAQKIVKEQTENWEEITRVIRSVNEDNSIIHGLIGYQGAVREWKERTLMTLLLEDLNKSMSVHLLLYEAVSVLRRFRLIKSEKIRRSQYRQNGT